MSLRELNDTAQKMKFSIKDFFSKSAVSCRFGHIYWRNPQWKTSFFLSNVIFWKWIDDLAFQCKISFNPDPNNQAQEIIFSLKIIDLNNSNVSQICSQKYRSFTLYFKLTFQQYLNKVLNKVNKTIGFLIKPQILWLWKTVTCSI